MRLRALLVSCCSIAALACAPGPIGSSEGAETGGDSSSSSAADTSTSSSTSSDPSETSSTDESSTDTDEEPDACPVDPELGGYEVLLDGHSWAVDYRFDGGIQWTQSCIVTSHTGALASGETIELECVDERDQAVEHRIELLAELDGAPLEAPVLVGQQVELALWLRVWFSGTVAWTLRDAEGNLLLLHYNGPHYTEPWAVEGEFAPPLEHIAPLTIGVDTDVCPLVCPEEDPNPGPFVPSDSCCSKETALRFDLGDGPVQIQHRSGGTIPGPAGAHAIVGTSIEVDVSTCNASDINGEYYVFTIVSGG